MWMMIFMSNIEFLINNYDKRRIPYEIRSKEYDKLRKRENRKKELHRICDDLFFECDNYKRLKLTKYQKERVIFLVDKFGSDFKRLHRTSKKEAIILSFIFFIKKNTVSSIRLSEYHLAFKYNLTDDVFEMIICRLLEYYMRNAPLQVTESRTHNHEILLKNAGKI